MKIGQSLTLSWQTRKTKSLKMAMSMHIGIVHRIPHLIFIYLHLLFHAGHLSITEESFDVSFDETGRVQVGDPLSLGTHHRGFEIIHEYLAENVKYKCLKLSIILSCIKLVNNTLSDVIWLSYNDVMKTHPR